jgi:two-component system CheB/CheR fusion protein
MPRSAIATGLVDYELPPAKMPAQLIAYALHAFGKPSRPDTVPAPRTESALKKIFVLLRAQTGHDFSQYKPNTIHRRIERRMAVHQVEAMARELRAPEGPVSLSPEEAKRTLEELRVHQIELEMQNEELRRTRDEPEEARTRSWPSARASRWL